VTVAKTVELRFARLGTVQRTVQLDGGATLAAFVEGGDVDG